MGNQNWGHLTIGGSMGWALAAQAPLPYYQNIRGKKIELRIRPLNIQIGLMSWLDTYFNAETYPKYLGSKAATLRTKLGESLEKTLDKIKLTWEMKFCSIARSSAYFYILSPGLFEIIAQSAHGSTKLIFVCIWMLSIKWVLWDFLPFGVLSSTKKVPNEIIILFSCFWGEFRLESFF